jgi:hypothetical protein
MSLDTTVPRTRRALLGAALGAGVATVASALGRQAPVRAANGDSVLLGRLNDATSLTIIRNTSGGHVLEAVSTTGTALRGTSDDGDGVFGAATGGGDGVYGYAVNTGTAIHAYAKSKSEGTALQVEGKATFSRSGRATVSNGRSYVDVDLTDAGGLAGSPLIVATCQSYRSGTWVAAARKNYPSTGTFRIYLNKTATAATYVAWVVLG